MKTKIICEYCKSEAIKSCPICGSKICCIKCCYESSKDELYYSEDNLGIKRNIISGAFPTNLGRPKGWGK